MTQLTAVLIAIGSCCSGLFKRYFPSQLPRDSLGKDLIEQLCPPGGRSFCHLDIPRPRKNSSYPSSQVESCVCLFIATPGGSKPELVVHVLPVTHRRGCRVVKRDKTSQRMCSRILSTRLGVLMHLIALTTEIDLLQAYKSKQSQYFEAISSGIRASSKFNLRYGASIHPTPHGSWCTSSVRPPIVK